MSKPVLRLNYFSRILAMILVLSPQFAAAQYSLTETGMTVGLGLVQTSGGGQSTLSLSPEVNGFFSHYTCGKRYGFHGDFGIQYSPNTIPLDFFDNGDITTSFKNLSVKPGFYFKIRPHTYHRPKELAFLIGARADVLFYSHIKSLQVVGSLRAFPGISAPIVNPNAHVSLWIRRPRGKDHSWFIQPGIEYAFLPVLKSDNQGNFMHARLFLNMGIQFWNDH